uniref:Uncharacterized protein n=1 Tax=Panagrolaimus davidi TaxID=227884 RepID=A0A914QMH1_9BILA
MVPFISMIFLLSFTSLQNIDGCIPTPNIDEDTMIPILLFPIPVTITPVETAPCSQCRDRIKSNVIYSKPPRFGRRTSDNVITDNCVDCVVLSQNGDSGPFIPTMMESADIICDDVLLKLLHWHPK